MKHILKYKIFKEIDYIFSYFIQPRALNTLCAILYERHMQHRIN
jgi:hypothetical protein